MSFSVRLSLLVLAGGLAAPAAAEEQFQLNVNPAATFFVGRGGQRAIQRFTINNGGNTPLRLPLVATDAWYDESGTVFGEPGSSPRGLGRWLSIPPRELVVPARGAASFEAWVRIPADAAPGTYFGGFLAPVGEQSAVLQKRVGGGVQAEAQVVTRIALLFHIDVLPSTGEKQIGPIQIVDSRINTPGSGEPLRVAVQLSNPSLYEAKATGTLAVFDSTGRAIGKADFDGPSLWPGQKRMFHTTLAMPLAPARYTAMVAFEAPGIPLVTRQIPFAVTAAPPAVIRREPAVPPAPGPAEKPPPAPPPKVKRPHGR